MVIPMLAAAVVLGAATLATAKDAREVDCDKESLQQALSESQSGDTLRVFGTCRQSIVVTIDRLTLDGQGTAVFDGGTPGGRPFGPGAGALNATIVIDGARAVLVRGFTIQNSAGGA